jgi:uncharacterized protein YPO0396
VTLAGRSRQATDDTSNHAEYCQASVEESEVNMKCGSYEWWIDQLEKSEARLKELEEKGIGALSKYDIQFPGCDMGLLQVVEEAKRLTRNHIKYEKERIAEFEAKGIQETLF